MAENLSKRIRAFASTIIILVLLAGVIGFYYFKYVPDRRAEFNRNAFLELSQIQSALQNQTIGYRGAIQNIIQHGRIDTSALIPFNYNMDAHAGFKKGDQVGSIRFEMYDSNRRWRMLIPVTDGNTLIYPLSISLYPLMSNLVATYRDVFDSYLLIRDVQKEDESIPFLGPDKKPLSAFPGFVLTTTEGENHKAKIMYHSPDLTTDFLVNPDSLLKKNESISLLNIYDVTVEGNSSKLFLYPFEIGNQKLTLAGLISDANYRKANLKIPFNFFTLFTVLLLLLVIHLPILRIYILGSNERIRDIDIRLIIGSYFIAGFFGFFLFTKIFLDKEQMVQNKEHLESLSRQITNNLNGELNSIYRQLNSFDHTLDSLCKKADTAGMKKDTSLLRAMTGPTKDSAAVRKLDTLFKPRIYTHPDNIFWIGDTGKWVARWGYKKSLTNSSLITVKDRQYFKDFKNREPLLDVPGINDSITIQPTLSKLEGEYVITMVKKSTAGPYLGKNVKDTTLRIRPYLIGLSSKIPAVYDVVMPPGYSFSIIDETGMIQFDAKPGRSLLSNMYKEIKDPDGIRQSALYRNERYFEHLTIRSRNMAVLSRPIKGMPYQLLVYYNHFRSDEFEEHLVALSAGLIGAVIALLILSTLVNQWSKTKTRMLKSHSHHFEWLHPSADPLKEKYYLHLIRWMLLLLAAYLFVWIFIETFAPRSEFSLLFISLLFPFYIALHYYELRERFYDVQEHRTGIVWYFSRPSLLLRGLLLIIILLLNCFTVIYKYDNHLAIPVLLSQLVWAAMIARSTLLFRHYMRETKNPQSAEDLKIADNSEKQQPYKIPSAYIWAILTGVILISIIPASAIFWLFFRNEKGLYGNADQLTMGRQIDQRRQKINQRIADYKFNPADPVDMSGINDLKFSEGIYMLSGRPVGNDSGAKYEPLQYPKTEYVHLHRMIFPSDSLALAWISPSDTAEDGTWYFARDSLGKSGPELVYRNRKDENNPNPFRLTSDSSASWNVAGLMAHSFSCTGTAFPIFFILGLCFSLTIAYFLTVSLSKRIFLVELHQVTALNKKSNSLADKFYGQSGIRPEIHLMIFNTCKKLDITTLDPLQVNIPFTDPWFPGLRDIFYFEKSLPIRELENKMPWLVEKLEPIYCALWKSLTPSQKFVLFDFAQDGFANYKASRDLQALITKGLLFFEDLRLNPMTISFQEYVLQMKEDTDLNNFLVKTAKEDTWKKLKNPLLIILTAVGIFIFITQEEVYQKITGLLATLTSLLPLLGNLFTKPAGKPDAG